MTMEQARQSGGPTFQSLPRREAGQRAEIRPGVRLPRQPGRDWTTELGLRPTGSDRAAERLAKTLGWVGLGLGLAQIAATRDFVRFIGAPDRKRSRSITEMVGWRELGAALAIFALKRPALPVRARVAGDAMDLALLGAAFTSRKAKPGRLAVATAAVVAIAAVDWLVATRLTRAKQVRRGFAALPGGIGARQAITVNRSPEELYRFWRDFGNLPRVMTHLEAVRPSGDGRRSHWVAQGPGGKSYEWDAEIVEDRPNELIAWRSLPGSDVENAGSVRFRPAPGGRGTEIVVELGYRPPAGLFGATAAKLMGSAPEQEVATDLRRFKQLIETGEIVRSDSSPNATPRPARPRA